jgi:chromosomal replication initiation ATPase DnaA
MQKKSEQLVLDLPHRVALGRNDFLVTPSNAAAVALIDQWPKWPTYGAIIEGPEGCGKSHLVEVWRQRSGAKMTKAIQIDVDGIPNLLEAGAAAIEDINLIGVDERGLFHALNLANQESKFLLLTSRIAPAQLRFKIADLASRINALPTVQILPPDDALLRGVLVKLFADRQISVDEGLINYVLLRMPRSMGAARNLVSEIDKLALTERAEVTKPLVARVIAKFESMDLFTSNDNSFTQL